LEPVTTAVVAALSSGATFVLKGVATEAIKSAVAALKTHIQKQHPVADLSVAQLELQPTSKARQAVLSEDLERAGASTDPELVQFAQVVVVLIQQSPEVARSIGVDVGESTRPTLPSATWQPAKTPPPSRSPRSSAALCSLAM
jgi:hypothetical protein